jgi:hypothetical protein
MVDGMDRTNTGGEVTLDNPIQVWHAISNIEPGGSDATGKVVHA